MADLRRKRKRTPNLVDAVPATRRTRPPRSLGSRLLRWALLLLIGGAMLVGAVVVAAFLIYGADPDLPRIESIGDYKPKVVTRVVDREGELLGEIFDERRTVVPRNKIP